MILKDKIALVTGAAQGIGAATAAVLARNGARVVVGDIEGVAANAMAASIPGAVALHLDVADEKSISDGISEIERSLGGLDILVNNAGVNTTHRVTIDEFPTSEWDKIMNIDLRGLFFVSRTVSKLMMARGGGRIVNISSVIGVVPARLQCAFAAAKAGVVHLTRTMAIELAPQNILVNCVAPGSILTEGTKELFYGQGIAASDKARRMLAHVPMGRPGDVGEIAHAILFFVNPETNYITGQTLCVDGGWTAGGFFRDF